LTSRRWLNEVIDGHRFYRLEVARYGERLALVVGPTTDGRWQARVGGFRRDTRELAEVGDYLTTAPTADAAKKVALAWAEGV
jgi:hypothetical protein